MKFFIWPKGIILRKKTKRRQSLKKNLQSRKLAREIVHKKIIYFNQFYNFSYGKVFIRSQKTRWGSCSSKGNLNFNYKISFLSPMLADYLVVHELCHLGEFNHSQKFWDLVAITIPDYKTRREELRSLDMLHM